MTPPTAKPLRLLKLTLQPVFVYDDGDQLTEVSTPPFLVAAGDWPTFQQDGWPALVAQVEQQVAEQLHPAPTVKAAPPNRATRRKRATPAKPSAAKRAPRKKT